MTGLAALAALLAAGTVWCWLHGPGPDLVLLGHPGGHRSGSAAAEPAGARAAGLSVPMRRLAAGCAVIAVLLTITGPVGWVLAPAAGLLLDGWLAGQPNRSDVARAARLRSQLPLALELMSAALSSGATTVAALLLAADGCGGPLGQLLREVAASLGLGAPPDEAWGPALHEPSAVQLGRLALRSTASGAAMAGACRELAGQEREARVVEAQVAVKRAGVLMTLPLALCFLPSFVLVGVVPIVVGLLAAVPL